MRPSCTWKMPRNHRKKTCTYHLPILCVCGWAQPFTFIHDLAHPSVHTAQPSLHFFPPNYCMHDLPTATVATPFHTNRSVAHKTYIHHFPIHALRCYPLYRSVHKHCHIRDVLLPCLVLQDEYCYWNSHCCHCHYVYEPHIKYILILSLHTTTAAEIKKWKYFYITKTVFLSWNYEYTDKFILHHIKSHHICIFSMHVFSYPRFIKAWKKI
jgi:hypothetical protein